MEESKQAKLSVSAEDGKVIVLAEIDIIEILKDLAKSTSNSIDDRLVSLIEAAKDNLDWVGISKGFE